MKQKLWIAWGVIGAQAILAACLGKIELAYELSILSAGFGWYGFFLSH